MKTISGAHVAYDTGHDWGKKMASVATVRIGACADEAADAIIAGDKRMRDVEWHPLRKVSREFVADYQRGFDDAVREGAAKIVEMQKRLYRDSSIPLCGASGAAKPRAKKVAAKRAPAKKPAKAKRRVAKKAAPKRASAKKATAKRASVKRPAAKKRAAPKRRTKAKRTTRKAKRK
jgi:hypothetical protein